MEAAAAAAVQLSDESRKNDRVFSSLRKRKNFEIFSICSDGGDIEAGDVGCPGAGMARPPSVKSRNLRKGAARPMHAAPMQC